MSKNSDNFIDVEPLFQVGERVHVDIKEKASSRSNFELIG